MSGKCFLCRNIYSRHPLYLEWREEFEKRSLSARSIGKLHYSYKRLRKKGQHGVNVDYMLFKFRIPISDIARAVFCIDKGQSMANMVIDFRAFVLCIWNLCTQPKDMMATYLLDLLGIPGGSVANVCAEIRGDQLSQDFELMDISVTSDCSHMKMTPDDISQLSESNHALLDPLLSMQWKCRKETLSVRTWNELSSRRVASGFSPKENIRLRAMERTVSVRSSDVMVAKGSNPRVEKAAIDEFITDYNSYNKSREGSEYTLTQSDVKLYSRESNYSSATPSDISSLTNGTRNNSFSNEFSARPSGSPNTPMLQISRHARRHSDPPSHVTSSACTISHSDGRNNSHGFIYIGNAAVYPSLAGPSFRQNGSHTTITAVHSTAASTSALLSLTSSALMTASSDRISFAYPLGDSTRCSSVAMSSGARVSNATVPAASWDNPPSAQQELEFRSARSGLSRVSSKIYPMGVDSLSSSSEGDDTINAAMG